MSEQETCDACGEPLTEDGLCPVVESIAEQISERVEEP